MAWAGGLSPASAYRPDIPTELGDLTMISKCEMTSAEYSAQPPVGHKKPLSLHGELDPTSRVKI